MEWFKFYGEEYLSDMKIRSLPPLHQHCWTIILALASSEENGGFIPFLTEEILLTTAGLVFGTQEWEDTLGVLKIFQSRKMITVETGGVTVINWVKKQGSSLSSYERVKKHREKKRNETESNILKHENDNDRIEENRIEERVETEVSNALPETTWGPEEVGPKKVSRRNKGFEEATTALRPVNAMALNLRVRKPEKQAYEDIVKSITHDNLMKWLALLPRTNEMKGFPKIISLSQFAQHFEWLKREYGKL